MITVTFDNQPYSNFKRVSVRRSLDEFAGSFSITATKTVGTTFPIKRGSYCQILNDGEPILSGFVERISPSQSTVQSDVVIEGRDITADLVDSTLTAGAIEIVPPVSLSEVIQQVRDYIGLDVSVNQEVSGLEDFTKEDLISSEAGQTAFSLIEKYARKRQVLLTTSGGGDIVITRNPRADGDSLGEATAGFQVLNYDGESNVLNSSSSFDDTNRFHEYIVVSEQNPVALNNFGSVGLDEIVDVQSESYFDNDIRETRKLVIVAENASNKDEALNRAKWEASVRKARSLNYSCDIDRLLTDLNELVYVRDDYEDINAVMLLNSFNLVFDVSSGSVTSLGFVDRNSYSLELEGNALQERSNKVGADIDISKLKLDEVAAAIAASVGGGE